MIYNYMRMDAYIILDGRDLAKTTTTTTTTTNNNNNNRIQIQ